MAAHAHMGIMREATMLLDDFISSNCHDSFPEFFDFTGMFFSEQSRTDGIFLHGSVMNCGG